MWNAYAAYADYYAALLLLVVFIVILVKKDIYTFAERVLLAMIAFSILILFAEGTTYLIDGRSGTFAHRINYLFNTFLFLAAPVMGMLWGIYIDYKLHGSHQRLRQHLYYLPLAMVGAVLSLINLFTPILFTIDDGNVFQREWAIYINMSLLYVLFVYLLVQLMLHRKKLPPHVFFGLLMLMIFPAIGGTLQMIWYGVASMFSMLALGLLTAYIAVETVAASKDALTKLFDRGKILDYLADLIERDIAFFILLMDMDNLKEINDSEGHRTGDQALVILSSALRETYGDHGMVARIGGDEFLIVSEQTDVSLHMNLMQRIHDRVKNASFGPTIDYSYGYDIIDEQNPLSLDEILHAVDEKMYEQKQIKQK